MGWQWLRFGRKQMLHQRTRIQIFCDEADGVRAVMLNVISPGCEIEHFCLHPFRSNGCLQEIKRRSPHNVRMLSAKVCAMVYFCLHPSRRRGCLKEAVGHMLSFSDSVCETSLFITAVQRSRLNTHVTIS